MTIDLCVEGVEDPRIMKLIARTVREVAKRASLPGDWSVFVAPSETRGEWDCGVRGPHGHHFASFQGEASGLPHVVDGQLRLALAAPPVPALRS